jgi:small basic protein (TIGR04137 family)
MDSPKLTRLGAPLRTPVCGSDQMTLDKSLKVKRGANRVRNVLTRVERLDRLKEADRWKDGDSPLGIPKVRVRKMTLKKKKKKKEEESADGAAAPAAKGAAAKGAAAKGGAKK